MTILFWACLGVILYTYIGYAILLFFLTRFTSKKSKVDSTGELPTVTFIVAAYNEEKDIEAKIENSLQFDYPKDKITFFFVTDGSNDRTSTLVEHYPVSSDVDLQLFHHPERRGKIAAVNRIMPLVDSDITIYSDANTYVNPEAIREIVRHYQNPKVGAVAGEKRIQQQQKEDASSAGEGIYWKYESTLKKWDAQLNSVVGAAGELFSIRTRLYEEPPQDSIVEDFYMTMRIAAQGYKVAYEPQAYARETASASVPEELKRKIRIAAGGFQSIVRLADLLNPFKHGLLTFQYVSHRVLRWTLAPLSLLVLFLVSLYLSNAYGGWYPFFFGLQVIFYVLAIVGYLLENRKIKAKIFFVPYYFCVMNYAVIRGFFRYLSGRQSVVWERAKRA
jgi:cellulose synthase/poly-beta-1,6-N-acetylglucosamine synthase-like glycosyltransferase